MGSRERLLERIDKLTFWAPAIWSGAICAFAIVFLVAPRLFSHLGWIPSLLVGNLVLMGVDAIILAICGQLLAEHPEAPAFALENRIKLVQIVLYLFIAVFVLGIFTSMSIAAMIRPGTKLKGASLLFAYWKEGLGILRGLSVAFGVFFSIWLSAGVKVPVARILARTGFIVGALGLSYAFSFLMAMTRFRT